MIILIMGLPNTGKTTLALKLVDLLSAVHWNADDVRNNLNKDLNFSEADRIEQAKRMRFLCDTVEKVGVDVIADFVCPTKETREAFGKSFTIWVDRIPAEESRFADTRTLFQNPVKYDFRYTKDSTVGDVIYCIKRKRLMCNTED